MSTKTRNLAIVGLALLGALAAYFPAGLAQEQKDSPNPLSGSSLAAERELRGDFAPDVEGVLQNIERQASDAGEFHLLVDWEVTEGFGVNQARDGMGLDSYKTGLNWYPPPEATGYWQSASLKVVGKESAFRITRLDEQGSEAEWWHKEGAYLYSSRMLDLLPFVTRWRAAEALESNLLAYGEGLGPILWTFQPGEFLRRAEHLELGEPERVNGRQLLTLIATPDWIKNPRTLPTRHYFPYNESKLRSWAELFPVIVYFVDPFNFTIEGAIFDLYKVTRSHAGRWTAGAEAKKRVLEAWVTQWGKTQSGARVPVRIEAKYLVDGAIRRRTVLTVQDEALANGSVTVLPALAPETGRRVYESWPPYQSAVYKARIQGGASDYANRVALVDALAFEGKYAECVGELTDLLTDFQNDQELVPGSLGGIDWHLGYAVYEILQQHDTAEYFAIWNDFAPVEPYPSILARAIDFYARWHRKTHEEYVEQHFRAYEQRFGMKARLLYVLERPLIDRVENEVDRGLDFEAILNAAQSDALRLQAIQGAVESYLRAKDYARAAGLLDRARQTLVLQESLAKFDQWALEWNERIDAELDALYEELLGAEILAKEDLLLQLKGRLERAKRFGASGELGRLNSLIDETETVLAELRQQ